MIFNENSYEKLFLTSTEEIIVKQTIPLKKMSHQLTKLWEFRDVPRIKVAI